MAILFLVLFGRYRALQNLAYNENNSSLLENLRDSLQDSDLIITGQINDPDNDGALIGYAFSAKDCSDPLAVLAFSISYVAKSLSGDYVSQHENYKYVYYSYETKSSSRVRTTLTWAQQTLLNGLALGRNVVFKDQLVVIWPKACSEPAFDWSLAWAVNTQ